MELTWITRSAEVKSKKELRSDAFSIQELDDPVNRRPNPAVSIMKLWCALIENWELWLTLVSSWARENNALDAPVEIRPAIPNPMPGTVSRYSSYRIIIEAKITVDVS